MTGPIAKRADQIVVGDRIPGESLPYQFAKGPAEVLFVCDATTLGDREEWTFVAYRHEDGYHDSTTVLSGAMFQVIPAPAADPTGLGYSRADDDPEVTQPIAGRVPAHLEDGRTGEVVMVGGHTAVEVDPPGLIVGDTAAEQMANAYAAYDRDEAEGFILVPHGPVKPPYGSPEREEYDRANASEPVHYRFGMHDTACGLKPGNVPAATADHAKVTCQACIDGLPF
jgi:hypothetical protein